jgi:hypothetical protein
VPDFRGLPFNYAGPVYSISVELELAEPNMTVGNHYEVWGIVVDNAATPAKAYAITVDDNQHFKFIDLSKVRRVVPSTP